MGWVSLASSPELDEFSIVLIPDTQRLSDSATWIAHFQAAADWIVANQEARNIELVLHLGDVVNGATTTEFDRAETPMDTIWGTGIPFASCIGNHDYDGGAPNATHSDTTQWNSYFGTGKYTGRSWWDGDFETSGKSENFYFRTNLGGRPTLILVVEFYPRSTILTWAGGVIEDNPTHDVIIVTHAYLNDDGTLTEDADEHGPDTYSLTDSSSGVEMWAAFRQHPNVVAVFGAHHINGPLTAELTSDGDEGNEVFQQFTNWQENDEGGDGRLVILTINPFTGWATREVYNARTDSLEAAYELTFQLYQQAGGADADAIHDNVAGEIQAITEKAVPVDADLLLIEDSAASYAKKKLQVGNLPSSGGGGAGELLMQDGVTAPPVPLENETRDDWLYADT